MNERDEDSSVGQNKGVLLDQDCLVVLQRGEKQGNEPAKAGSPEDISRRE